MELGRPYPERKKLLEELQSTDSDKTFFVPFQGNGEYFKIHCVPIDLLKYRLNNGRTYAAQAEYLAKNVDIADDFFTSNPESDEAISVQHDLLKGMIEEKDLLAHFEANDQTEPLILTNVGFVVNGNRRLCAMRELYESDTNEYKRFAHIYVVILPPADEKDIDELEAKLQILPDIKADYTWYSRALMMRRRQEEHQYDIGQLSDLYALKETDVRELIDMIGYGEEYLENIGAPGEYHLLDGTEYGFRQIRKVRSGKKLTSEADKDLFTELAFALISSPDGGRVYESIPAVAENLEKLKTRLLEEIEVPEADDSTKDDDDDDLLSVISPENDEVSGLVESLEEETNKILAREVIDEVIRSEALKHRERKRSNFVINQLKKANSAISDALNSFDAETKLDGIQEQIDTISTSVGSLKTKLDARTND
jgi:hypothetical protein